VNVRRPRGDDIHAACGQLMAANSETMSGDLPSIARRQAGDESHSSPVNH
jgi:hypothetical protein